MRSWPTLLMLAPALAITLGLGGVALGLGLARSFDITPFGVSVPTADAWFTVAHLPGLGASVALTLAVAAMSTLLAGAIGLAAALALRAAVGSRGRSGLAALMLQFNLAVPHVVVAAGLLFLLAQSGLLARLGHAAGLIAAPADFPALVADPFAVGVITGYAVKEAPFVAAVVLVQLAAIGDKPFATARMLGASRRRVVRSVMLPMIAPGFLAALAVVFAFALGAYEMPAVLGASRPKLLPVLAYELFTSKDIADRPWPWRSPRPRPPSRSGWCSVCGCF